MRFVLLLLLSALSLQAEASVWPTRDRWSAEAERSYEEWVRKKWRVDIFSNPSSPYYGVHPDCADTVYSMRAIFAFENGLPFAMVDPTTGRSIISNEISKFDAYPAGSRRMVAFLGWLYDLASTSTLPYDTYPVVIHRTTVRSGSLMLAKESKHSYTIKKINEAGVPLIYYSTQANQGDLKTRSWPSVGFLFSEGIKQPSGIRDFRWPDELLKPVWEVSGYSDEQYAFSAGSWISQVQKRLAIRDESDEEALSRMMNDLCEQVTTRIDLVRQAVRRRDELGDVCLGAVEYDDLSTPSRDRQIGMAYQDLSRTYERAGGRNARISRKMAEQLANIFSTSGQEETKTQFCRIEYAPGKVVSLGEFRRRLAAGRVSSNPNDPLYVRWGYEQGPSEKALRCPTY